MTRYCSICSFHWPLSDRYRVPDTAVVIGLLRMRLRPMHTTRLAQMLQSIVSVLMLTAVPETPSIYTH